MHIRTFIPFLRLFLFRQRQRKIIMTITKENKRKIMNTVMAKFFSSCIGSPIEHDGSYVKQRSLVSMDRQ